MREEKRNPPKPNEAGAGKIVRENAGFYSDFLTTAHAIRAGAEEPGAATA